MNRIPYRSKFAALVQKLSKRTHMSLTKIMEHLKGLEEMVRVDTFDYSSEKDEVEGRKALLDLWERLMDIVDLIPAYRQNTFYALIFYIITRYEFDLIHLATERSSSKRKGKRPKPRDEVMKPSSSLAAKLSLESSDQVEAFRRYRGLLVLQTSKLMTLFKEKTVSKPLRKFCMQVFSIAYFRIPMLSGYFLNACTDKVDTDDSNAELAEVWSQRGRSPEWMSTLQRNVDASLSETIDRSIRHDVVCKAETTDFFDSNPTLFQWTLFVENRDRQLLEHMESLQKLTSEKYFFRFISRLVAHVNDVLHKPVAEQATLILEEEDEDDEDGFGFLMDRSIHWGLIPGYWSLIKALLERCAIPVDRYRSDMKRCFSRVLANPELLHVFTKMFLQSTSCNRKLEVNACLDLLDLCFDASCGPNLDGPLPASFCYDLFFKAIDILLSSEQFEVLLKTLCFIYTHAGRFYGEYRSKLLQELLLHKHFFKFFLHWYPAIRRQYHHILVYKFIRRNTAIVHDTNVRRTDLSLTHRTSIATQEQPQSSWMRKVSKKLSGSDAGLILPENMWNEPISAEVDAIADLSRQRTLFQQDPPVDSCEVITTRMTEQDITEDDVLENNLQVYIHMLEEQLKDPMQNYFDQSKTVYVREGLRQYTELRLSKERLQKKKHLDRFDVLTPSMFYDIPKDPRDIG